jgi:predicted ATPase
MDHSEPPRPAAAAFKDAVVQSSQAPSSSLIEEETAGGLDPTATTTEPVSDDEAGGSSLTISAISPSPRADSTPGGSPLLEDDGETNHQPLQEKEQQRQQQQDPGNLDISSPLFTNWTFVGRTIEQETIRKAYQRAKASSNRFTSMSSSTSTSSSSALPPPPPSPQPPLRELVLIEGPPGVGKKCLVRQALRDEVASGSPSSGYLCAGRFDSTPRPEPQAAIVDAVRELVATILQRGDDEVRRVGRCLLSGAIGGDRDALLQIFPAIQEIFEKSDEAAEANLSTPGEDAATGGLHDDPSVTSSSLAGLMSRTDLNQNHGASGTQMNKFKDVVRRLLRAVASPDHPLVLVLDDVQWADESSLDFVWSLLSESGNRSSGEANPGLLVIATYRVGNDDDDDDDDESGNNTGPNGRAADPTARVWSKLQQDKNRVNVELVKLHNLGRVDVEALLAQLLGRHEASAACATEETTTTEPPTKTASIAALSSLLYGCTRGNPTLIRENMLHLWDLGLFSFNKATSSWEWDPEEARVELVPSLPTVVGQRLRSLTNDGLETLKVASCFGNAFDEELLGRLVSVPILPGFELAALRGLVTLNTTFQRYTFSHNQVKASAYELIPIDERKALHSRLGRTLWESLRPDEVERFMFPVVGQFLVGDKCFVSLRERKEIALLFARAGERAIAMSSFQSAHTFLLAAIDCLGDSQWRESYTLSLNLHNAAAEVACCIGLHANAEALVSEVIKHARCSDDTYRAQSTRIYALGGQNLLLEAISAGVIVLRTLGVSFPPNPTRLYIWRQFLLLKWTLRRKYTPQSILRLPFKTDRRVLAASQILNLIYLYATSAKPELAPLVGFALVRLTLKHGLCPISCMGFISFAMCLCGYVP